MLTIIVSQACKSGDDLVVTTVSVESDAALAPASVHIWSTSLYLKSWFSIFNLGGRVDLWAQVEKCIRNLWTRLSISMKLFKERYYTIGHYGGVRYSPFNTHLPRSSRCVQVRDKPSGFSAHWW